MKRERSLLIDVDVNNHKPWWTVFNNGRRGKAWYCYYCGIRIPITTEQDSLHMPIIYGRGD